MRKLLVILSFIFLIPNIFGYIDPGTGGYLISSLWSWLVGMFALLFAVVIRFFKYKVWFFCKKYKYYVLPVFILFVGVGVKLLFFNGHVKDVNLPDYDKSKIGGNIINSELVLDGYNLYNGILIDMDGNQVMNWSYNYLSVLDEDGFYYAQNGYEALEFGKFYFNGTPVWIKEIPIHHEIYLTDYDTVVVMTKKSENYNDRLVEFDVILEFDKDGEFLTKWSTYENLLELQTFHRELELDKPANTILPEDHKKNMSIWGAEYDYYHMNAFSVVPENSMKEFHPAFKPGNWIVSFRHGSMTFILDKDTKKVLWSGIFDQIKDKLEGQHLAKMSENGNIRIFDNGRYRSWSRIVEINPATMEVVSEIKFDDFFTYSQGFFQDLPNGNILITESEDGRVFEIDSEMNIVWEFFNPKFKEMENEDDRKIHDEIYRMTRYDKEFIDKLLTEENK
jgi:hypothetical protein